MNETTELIEENYQRGAELCQVPLASSSTPSDPAAPLGLAGELYKLLPVSLGLNWLQRLLILDDNEQ